MPTERDPQMPPKTTYEHTQEAPLHYLLFAVLIGELALAWTLHEQAMVFYLLCGMSVLLLVLWLSFQTLTVEDRGDHLLLYFGPSGLFRQKFPYEKMTGASMGRSSLLDGWGIHYTFKGWIYNLWGFDCVEIQQGNRLTRIGSDDAENLTEFLRSRISENP